MSALTLSVGVKTDPIEYRYSFPWLFRLMADEGVRHVQLGTFFEMYQLPDAFFLELRREAEGYGLIIDSVFTAHRELGGFYRDEPGFVDVARRNFERLIEIGALVGAVRVGSNPGAVLRDQMEAKQAGIARYLRHMAELLHFAGDRGVKWLTMEPMSCLAEPPTLPAEIRQMMAPLVAAHTADPAGLARPGLCADVSHGYANSEMRVVHDHMALLESAIPWTCEVHLKNTDAVFGSTFGFTGPERARGVVDLADVRRVLLAGADDLPTDHVVGYLEIGGPKTGRDYSDRYLEEALRESLRHCRASFETATDRPNVEPRPVCAAARTESPGSGVLLAPSMMCADMGRLADAVRELEAAGADMLHFDIMDAHFTPNMPLGLLLIHHLRPLTATPFDVHLMVDDNDFFVRQLSGLPIEYVSVHVESCTHLDRTLGLIRDMGARAGAALNPATPVTALRHVIGKVDFVLVMSVNPGFAGQPLVSSALAKIAEVRSLLELAGRTIPIQIDGNVSFENIPAMVAQGADILVCGTSSVFRPGSAIASNAAQTRERAAAGMTMRRACGGVAR